MECKQIEEDENSFNSLGRKLTVVKVGHENMHKNWHNFGIFDKIIV